MKRIICLGISILCMATSAFASMTIRQAVSAKVADETCYIDSSNGQEICSPNAIGTPLTLTANLAPTLGGDAVGFIGVNGTHGYSCFDNLGQQWSTVYISSLIPWTSPPSNGQTAGITSVVCPNYTVAPGTGEGYINVVELSGVNPTPQSASSAGPNGFPSGTQVNCGVVNPNSLSLFKVSMEVGVNVTGTDPGAPSPQTVTSNLLEASSNSNSYYLDNSPGLQYIYQLSQWESLYVITADLPVTATVTVNNSNQAPFETSPNDCEALQFAAAPDISGDIGSSAPPSGCDGTCGLPINLRSGNTWIEEQDYALPGLGGGLRIDRTWNSMWASTSPPNQVGMFGDSWISNYEEAIQVNPNNQAKYWRADGSAWTLTWNTSSQSYTVTSPPDEHATLTFNSTTTLFTLAFPDGPKEIFSNPGRLQSVSDPNGNTTTLSYDTQNRVTQATDAAGRVLTFSYANSTFPNQVSSIQDSVGTVATYSYLTGGLLNSVTYADGSVKNFTYDSNGLILGVTDASGKIFESHTYDALRRGLTSQRAGGVDLVTANYGTNSAQISDTNGNTTTYGITTVGSRRLVSSIVGSGCDSCIGRGNWSYSYDTQGNRTQAIDPLGHFTNLAYDANGNVTSRKLQVDSANDTQNWAYTYNTFNEVLTATDPLGNQATNTYDAKGNLLTSTTPSPTSHGSGSKTTFVYDTKGEVTSITDPNTNKTSIFYTTAGLVDHITDPQTHTTKFTYDARGNRTSVTDANNQQTTFTYDSMNRLTKITYPTSPATFTQFGYDYRGRKTSVTDPNGKLTQYAYDDADRLTAVTDANNGITQYAYDNESNLTTVTDVAGHQTTFQYDPYGHVTQAAFPSSWAETYSYDLNGNLLTKTDRNGHVINYGYDFLNRLSSKSYPDSTSVNYTYDLANRLTQVSDPTGTYAFSFDGMNRLTQSSTTYSFISGKTFTVKYGYDASSNRTSMTDPQNASTSYAFDTLNRITTLTYPSKTNYTFAYDALSRRTQLSRPNGLATNYQYDTLSRLTSILHQKSTTTLDGATYVYDATGNRTSKTDKRTNVTSTFSYDPLYELTQVLQGSNTTETYGYDAVGNRLSSLGVSPYAYNSSNELTSTPSSTYSYDNNGNTLTKLNSSGTTQYNWDFENRLQSVVLPGSGGTVSFKYDPFGHRIQKTSSSGTTNYLYDGSNVLEEVDGSGNVLARYVQSTGIDEPLAETRGSTTSYYQADVLGSITSLSNSSAVLVNTYGYDSYGQLTASSGSVVNPYRYTGREFDSETGVYYYRARYYDAQAGRFANEDPLRFRGGANFYAYANGNPISWIDPLGLSGWVTIYSSGTSGLGNHSWISYTPDGGTTTTYGTWGNNPQGLGNGLQTNLEIGRTGDASRTEYLNDAQEAQLLAVIQQYKSQGANGWQLGRPCSTFAAAAWQKATGEKLNTRWGPISNPSTLTNSIISANGGQANLTVQQQPNGSSSWSKSYGSNPSSSSSSSGSSLNSSGSSLQ